MVSVLLSGPAAFPCVSLGRIGCTGAPGVRAHEALLGSISRRVISLGSAHALSLGREASPEARSQAKAVSVCPPPCLQHSDMPEEMRVETMELCVTACEKFSNNNEVLPSVRPLVSWVTPVAPVPAASYTECRWGQARPFLGNF